MKARRILVSFVLLAFTIFTMLCVSACADESTPEYLGMTVSRFTPSAGLRALETESGESFSAVAGEDAYVVVHLFNPLGYGITSLTLNEINYPSNRFESSSTDTMLVLKITADETVGDFEYTLNSINYQSKSKIKPALISGDQTVTVKLLGYVDIAFDANGGTAVAAKSVVDGDPVSAPVEPTKTGYDFSGWHTSNTDFSQSTAYDFTAAVTGNITLYANWTPTEYTISYANLSGGTNPNSVNKYTIETETFTLVNPTRVGYTGAWDDDTIEKGSTGNVTVTAVWTPNTYTVTYDYNVATGGNTTETAEVIYDAQSHTFAKPTHTNYTFGGWYSAPGGGGTQYADKNGAPTRKWNIADDATLYAYWLGTSGIKYTKSGSIVTVTMDGSTLSGKAAIQPYYQGLPVTTIAASAFTGSSITEMFLPDTITSIGISAFEYCEDLTSINLPDSITSIGRDAFYGCRKLSAIHIPSSLESTDYQSFCRIGITSVWIPGTLKTIEDRTFENCEKLGTVVMEEGVESIGDAAFGWSAVHTVVIPVSVTRIKEAAFYAVNSGLRVLYGGTAAQWNAIDITTTGVYGSGYLLQAKRYYYSEENVKGTWHYDNDGMPAIWSGYPEPTLTDVLLGDPLDDLDAVNAQYDAHANPELNPKLVFEAENAIRSKTDSGTIEASVDSSGGKSIGHYEGTGNSLTFNIHAASKITGVDIAIRLAAAEWDGTGNVDMVIGNRIVIAVNGETVDLEGLVVKQDNGYYYSWTMLVIRNVTLEAGFNEILMECFNSRFPNTDVLYVYTDSTAVLSVA